MKPVVVEKWDGKPISRPGVYSGVPLDFYHSRDACVGPSISSSGLRTIFSKSPAHYYVDSPFNEDPDEDEADEDDIVKKESADLVFGSAAHWLILGEENFSAKYVMRPLKDKNGEPWNGNRGTCRNWMKEQHDLGRTVLTPIQIKAIRGMARKLSQEPLVQDGCLNGGVELSLFWIDKETGIWLRARPDTIPYDSLDVVDLKTTKSFGDDLDKAIFHEFRYDLQGALVRLGMREVLGLEMASFTLVFVGKKRPYAVEIVAIGMDDLDSANGDLRVALRTFKYCLESGNWFGPAGTQNDARYAHKAEWIGKRTSYQRGALERELVKPMGEA